VIPKIIIGLGTGRCGTWTLYRLLNAQPGVAVAHEGFPLPWQVDVGALWYYLVQMFVNFEGDFIGNVSFVWINYIGKLMGNLKDPRCICLRRDREEVVESFCAHAPNENHWTDPDSKHYRPEVDGAGNVYSILFPKYDLPKTEAIVRYWNKYYALAEYLAMRYPKNFLLIDMHAALNTEDGQREMLTFAGIPAYDQAIFLNKKLNTRHVPQGGLFPEAENVFTGSEFPKAVEEARP